METNLKVREGTKTEKLGLNGEICEAPKYWCLIHEVWVTEEEANKKCMCKPDMDMIGTHRCKDIVPVEEVPMYHRIYKK